MPVYRFLCNKCGHEFKGIFKLNEKDVKCPKCNSKKTERLVSRNVGISYNGRGFTKAFNKAKNTASKIAEKGE